MFWNVRAMPSATRACGGRSVISTPRNNTLPSVTGNRPQIRLTIVLLPEPFGPISPRISPSATARSTCSTAHTPPNCLVSNLSSSTGRFLAVRQVSEGGDRAGIEQSARPDVHARALRRDLVLAHRAENRASARLVHPPQRDHDQRYYRPDEQHDFERAPAVLREIANLPETLAAERPDADVALGDLVIEVEEEQPHRLAEGDGGDDKHQALDPQRREADGAGNRSGDEGGGE